MRLVDAVRFINQHNVLIGCKVFYKDMLCTVAKFLIDDNGAGSSPKVLLLLDSGEELQEDLNAFISAYRLAI